MIAFPARDGHIYLADSDASGLRQLTSGRCPAWSPDSKWIAFVDGPEIDVIKANGSGRRLVSLDGGGACPNWAPAQRGAGRGS